MMSTVIYRGLTALIRDKLTRKVWRQSSGQLTMDKRGEASIAQSDSEIPLRIWLELTLKDDSKMEVSIHPNNMAGEWEDVLLVAYYEAVATLQKNTEQFIKQSEDFKKKIKETDAERAFPKYLATVTELLDISRNTEDDADKVLTRDQGAPTAAGMTKVAIGIDCAASEMHAHIERKRKDIPYYEQLVSLNRNGGTIHPALENAIKLLKFYIYVADLMYRHTEVLQALESRLGRQPSMFRELYSHASRLSGRIEDSGLQLLEDMDLITSGK